MANEHDIQVMLKLQSTLAASIKAEEEKVKASMGKMSDHAKGFGSTVNKMAGEVGSSWTGMVKGMVVGWATVEGAFKLKEMITGSLELGESINAMSVRLGMSTETFQKWSHIAKEGNANIDTLSKGFKELAVKAEANDPIFKRLGISTRDQSGALRENSDLMADVVSKLSDIKNPTERLAIAQKLLGKAAGDAMNLAEMGADKFKELANESSKFGLTKEQLDSLEAANKSIERMGDLFKIATAKAVSFFTPTIEFYAKMLSGESAKAATTEIQIRRTVEHYKAEKDINGLFALRGEALKKIGEIEDAQAKAKAEGHPGRQRATIGEGLRSYKVWDKLPGKEDIDLLKKEATAYASAMKEINGEGSAGTKVGKTGISKEEKDAIEQKYKRLELQAEAIGYENEKEIQLTKLKYEKEKELAKANGDDIKLLTIAEGRAIANIREKQQEEIDVIILEGRVASAQIEDHRLTAFHKYEADRYKQWAEEKYNTQKEVDEADEDARSELVKIRVDKKLAMEQKTEHGRLKLLLNNQKLEMAAFKAHGGDLTAIEKEQAEERLRFAIAEAQQKVNTGAYYADMTIKSLETIAEATHANATVRKRIQQGAALVDGARAVMGGWSAASQLQPYPVMLAAGIASTVLIGAETAAQIAIIEQQKMAYGGVVTGGTAGQDSVPAMLMPGEIVYNPAHPNPALASIIGGSSTTNNNGNVNIHMSGAVVVQGSPSRYDLKLIQDHIDKGVTKALQKAQIMGKLNASGLVIRR
jgi:hypothetical protein